jgi:adenosylhomocysteinase
MEGIPVRTIDEVLATCDIYVTATGNKGIIMLKHMKKMKNNAIICNIGHFDNEIDMAGLENSGAVKTQIKPQVDRVTLFVSAKLEIYI